MSGLQPSTKLTFGDANTLGSKAFTFAMAPHPHTAADQDSASKRGHRGSADRYHTFEEITTPDSKRHKPLFPPSNRDTHEGPGTHTPYPALKSERGSRSDDSDEEGFDLKCYVHTTVKEHLEPLIASIKRRVKDECEIALDTAWKEVVSY